MKVNYHPLASLDVVDAARYYESRVSGLGADFLEEIDAAIESIEPNPLRFPAIEDTGLRRYLLKRFPYGIYFTVEGGTIRILLVKHHSRDPDFGRDRQ